MDFIDGPIERRQRDAAIYAISRLSSRRSTRKKIARGNRVISGEDDASPSGDGHVRGIRDNIDAAERTTQGVPLKS